MTKKVNLERKDSNEFDPWQEGECTIKTSDKYPQRKKTESARLADLELAHIILVSKVYD